MAERMTGRASREEGARLFAEQDHLAAYRAWSNAKTDFDPRLATGGKWDEIGQVQFEALVVAGMLPHHHLLDIGCGTLRGGRHFIRYLDPARYVGFDLADRSIAWARELLLEEGLQEKLALLLATDGQLKFDFVDGRRFDYILAQSVFTHLPIARIEECFAHIGRVMHGDSRFLFTLTQVDCDQTGRGVNIYDHAAATVFRCAEGHGLTCESLPYPHPRKQRLFKARFA